MEDFYYAMPSKIFFGPSMGEELFALKMWEGKRVALLSASDKAKEGGHLDIVEAMIQDVASVVVHCSGAEPTYRWITTTLGGLRSREVDLIVAVGGHRTFEATKLLALLLGGDKEIDQVLGEVGRGEFGHLNTEPFPYVVVPTLATLASHCHGTALLYHREGKNLVSLTHPELLPRAIWFNPSFCLTDASQNEAASIVAASLGRLLDSEAFPAAVEVSTRIGLQGVFRLSYQLGIDPNNYAYRAELLWLAAVSAMDLPFQGQRLSLLNSSIARAAALCTLMLPAARFTRCLAESALIFLKILAENDDMQSKHVRSLSVLAESLSVQDPEEGIGRALDFFYSRLGELEIPKLIASYYPDAGIHDMLGDLRNVQGHGLVQDFFTPEVELILAGLAFVSD